MKIQRYNNATAVTAGSIEVTIYARGRSINSLEIYRAYGSLTMIIMLFGGMITVVKARKRDNNPYTRILHWR